MATPISRVTWQDFQHNPPVERSPIDWSNRFKAVDKLGVLENERVRKAWGRACGCLGAAFAGASVYSYFYLIATPIVIVSAFAATTVLTTTFLLSAAILLKRCVFEKDPHWLEKKGKEIEERFNEPSFGYKGLLKEYSYFDFTTAFDKAALNTAIAKDLNLPLPLQTFIDKHGFGVISELDKPNKDQVREALIESLRDCEVLCKPTALFGGKSIVQWFDAEILTEQDLNLILRIGAQKPEITFAELQIQPRFLKTEIFGSEAVTLIRPKYLESLKDLSYSSWDKKRDLTMLKFFFPELEKRAEALKAQGQITDGYKVFRSREGVEQVKVLCFDPEVYTLVSTSFERVNYSDMISSDFVQDRLWFGLTLERFKEYTKPFILKAQSFEKIWSWGEPALLASPVLEDPAVKKKIDDEFSDFLDRLTAEEVGDFFKALNQGLQYYRERALSMTEGGQRDYDLFKKHHDRLVEIGVINKDHSIIVRF